MALGTATIVGQRMKSHSHALDVVDISFLGDDSYPTGGTAEFQAYVRAALPEKREVTVLAVLPGGLNGGNTPIYDAANDKLLMVVAATGVEVANEVDLSSVTMLLKVLCY